MLLLDFLPIARLDGWQKIAAGFAPTGLLHAAIGLQKNGLFGCHGRRNQEERELLEFAGTINEVNPTAASSKKKSGWTLSIGTLISIAAPVITSGLAQVVTQYITEIIGINAEASETISRGIGVAAGLAVTNACKGFF